MHQPAHTAMCPVGAFGIILIPLMDMVAIMFRRARKGQSVLKPERDHLHHIFMRSGFTDREALLAITCLSGLCLRCMTGRCGMFGGWLFCSESSIAISEPVVVQASPFS